MLKKYLEMRAKKQAQMKALIEKANTETRALTDEEMKQFDALEAEIREIDETINRMQSQRDLDQNIPSEDEDDDDEEEEDEGEEDAEAEERAFEAYIRGRVEERSAVNMTKDDNGAVVPQTIAKKIIEKVVDICPIFKDSERYNVKGTLTIPYYDDGESDIVCTYADEFTEGESTSGKIKNITLTGFLGRAITDVSKSLVNNSDFDIVNFVVNHMAKAIAKFLEKELLVGTPAHDEVPAKILGLSTLEAGVTLAANDKITTDELIDIQEAVPDEYQADAYWIMNRDTRKKIRKLKDADGNYLFNRDLNSRWGYTLLGKDVYCSNNMPKLGGASRTVIYYGDMKGLATKVSENISIDILREVKARQHAIEVIGFVEVDSKVQNGQMITKAVTPA